MLRTASAFLASSEAEGFEGFADAVETAEALGAEADAVAAELARASGEAEMDALPSVAVVCACAVYDCRWLEAASVLPEAGALEAGELLSSEALCCAPASSAACDEWVG